MEVYSVFFFFFFFFTKVFFFLQHIFFFFFYLPASLLPTFHETNPSMSLRTALRTSLSHIRHTRSFQSAAIAAKNPYYFYDLVSKTPKTSFDPAQFSFNHGHLSASERAALVFGQIGNRQDRRLDAQRRAMRIAGLVLPARPDEPNNCCMSGCIDCVWELYKEDLADWKQKRKEIRHKLLVERTDLDWPESVLGPEPVDRKKGTSIAMADKFVEDNGDDDLDPNIKAFLKTEMKLKEKKRKLLEQQKAAQAATSSAQTPQQQASTNVA